MISFLKKNKKRKALAFDFWLFLNSQIYSMRMGTSYQEIRQGLHGMTQSRDKELENGKQSLSPCIKILTTINWVLLGHSYNPSSGEAKAGGQSSRLSSATHQMWGQPGIQEIMPQEQMAQRMCTGRLYLGPCNSHAFRMVWPSCHPFPIKLQISRQA